jgi:hypothetical protein
MPSRIRQVTIAARSGRTYVAHAILNFENTFKWSAQHWHAARKAAYEPDSGLRQSNAQSSPGEQDIAESQRGVQDRR